MILAIVAYRHHDHHRSQEHPAPIEFPGAAAWRFPMVEHNDASGTRHKNGIGIHR
jgi:hypothetical protein